MLPGNEAYDLPGARGLRGKRAIQQADSFVVIPLNLNVLRLADRGHDVDLNQIGTFGYRYCRWHQGVVFHPEMKDVDRA